MIKTGVDIIDVDHMVPSMERFANLLTGHQVFSGKSDPVTVIQNGDMDSIISSVSEDYRQAGGRCIVSAGCEVTPETTVENMHSFRKSVFLLKT
jgi:uroporphyrinogen-III decarboxylase